MHTYRVPPSSVGVYHLMQGDRVWYVGQSINIMGRVGSWRCHFADQFDGYRVFPCEPSRLNALEREHILRHQPPLNKAGRSVPYMGVTRAVRVDRRLYDSADAYIDELPERIGSTVICGRLRIAPNSPALVALAGAGLFPAPVCGRGDRYWWDRETVRSWLTARDASLAAARSTAA